MTYRPFTASFQITIYHMDDEALEYSCDLLDMPNWAFSYAMALKRLEDAGITPEGRESSKEGDADVDNTDDNKTNEHEDLEPKTVPPPSADEALRQALVRFPDVLQHLVDENNLDTTGRSFQMDWPPVLEYFRLAPRVSQSEDDITTNKAVSHVTKIFILRSHKLWSSEQVVAWLYQCALHVKEQNLLDVTMECVEDSQGEVDTVGEEQGMDNIAASVKPSSRLRSYPKALVKYLVCDLEDYEDSVRRLPPDANPLDEALVAPALALDPHGRRRFRLNNGRGGGGGVNGLPDENDLDLQQRLLAQFGMADGAGDGATLRVNPEDPIVQVFLQSLLPWARVDGVP
jgi:hypothetical protein